MAPMFVPLMTRSPEARSCLRVGALAAVTEDVAVAVTPVWLVTPLMALTMVSALPLVEAPTLTPLIVRSPEARAVPLTALEVLLYW